MLAKMPEKNTPAPKESAEYYIDALKRGFAPEETIIKGTLIGLFESARVIAVLNSDQSAPHAAADDEVYICVYTSADKARKNYDSMIEILTNEKIYNFLFNRFTKEVK